MTSGFSFFSTRLGERGIENLAGDVEGQFSHGSVPLREMGDYGVGRALSRLIASTRAT